MTIDNLKYVMERILSQLEQHYIFPEKVNEVRALLEENFANSKYQLDVVSLCKVITEDLQKVTKDKHLTVFYRPGLSVDQSLEQILIEDEMKKGKVDNYGFPKMERLTGNVGYIDIRKFYSVQLGAETVISVMNYIANTDALIIDLRKNGGGRLEMITFLASFFFETSTHVNSVYNRSENTLIQEWTQPFVPGKRYVNKPIFLLTSDFTFSGGEAFAYSLQQLNRAKVVGEVTGGGAHPVMFARVEGDIHIRIPNRRSINPITNTNWEGTGVFPNVQMKNEEAFDYSYKKALQYVKEKYEPIKGYEFLVKEINSTIREITR
ncbi:S41 family peptidase [Sutcliffiella cohnii]